MDTFRAGLVGISGYAGMELARLLCGHPAIKLTMACSRADAGKKLGDFYPFLRDQPGSEIEICEYSPQAAIRECDVVFLAVPAGAAMHMAPDLLEGGVKVVDLSADFRLHDASVYEDWYERTHECVKYLPRAVYGLPELYAARISRASLVANPGCYPTASLLGLYAALKNDLVIPDSIIIDAKSGASGAGRKASVPNLFCEVSDNFRPYGSPRHRHTPEIEQEISIICNQKTRITFTPHLVPMKRGILVSIYATLKDPELSVEKAREIYLSAWSSSRWIRVMPKGELPQTSSTRGSMYCDIGLAIDERTGRLLIFSAIDNLCRGASGQALANANLMLGLDVDEGMKHLAPLP